MSVLRPQEHELPEPRPAARTAKSERTRAEILETAFKFLWSHPFREMTVNSLMESTHVSRPSFYQYFRDVHDLMETLLTTLEGEILEIASPWLSGTGDPVALLNRSLAELVRVCHDRGPFLKAISDAAATDERLEEAWNNFLRRFDDAVSGRIAADQELGLIKSFDPRPLAMALNRLDAYTFIQAFGQHPRRQQKPILLAIARLWISSLYGEKWTESRTSTLRRVPRSDTHDQPQSL